MFLIPVVLAAAGIFIINDRSARIKETSQERKQKKTPVVEVAAATRTTVFRRLELTGSVEAYRVARLASPAEGPVENIHVREGDLVDAGTKLFRIGRRQGAEALVTSLREELKKEKDELSRVRELVRKNAIAEEELDQARTAYEKVQAQLIQARESAEDYTITAPWHGIVSQLEVKEGEFVAPRTVLMEMYDPDSLVIRTGVPERYAAEIRPDMRVDIRLDAYPQKTVQGRITRIYPYLDDRMRTRTVEILPDKPVELLPGMFARLQVVLEEQDDAVVVPKEAIVSTPQGESVFVVQEGKAEQRGIETGIEEEKQTQILSGVGAGDKVVVAGNQKLKPGAAVRLAKGGKPKKEGSRNTTEPAAQQGGSAGGGQQ
ncbi:MAG: efflux RND transporter periplasmic adaptor subunit [Desulfosalsimonadaceae bacterium]